MNVCRGEREKEREGVGVGGGGGWGGKREGVPPGDLMAYAAYIRK
jgi:hypothetical protein